MKFYHKTKRGLFFLKCLYVFPGTSCSSWTTSVSTWVKSNLCWTKMRWAPFCLSLFLSFLHSVFIDLECACFFVFILSSLCLWPWLCLPLCFLHWPWLCLPLCSLTLTVPASLFSSFLCSVFADLTVHASLFSSFLCSVFTDLDCAFAETSKVISMSFFCPSIWLHVSGYKSLCLLEHDSAKFVGEIQLDLFLELLSSVAR